MTASDILRDHQIKKTAGRLAIVQTLKQSETPLAEAEIKDRMQEAYDRTTFYRNINTLLEKGVLHRIVVDNTTVRFALNCCEKGHQHRNTHAHFYCQQCQSVLCLHELIIPEPSVPEGYVCKDMELILKGICKSCHA